MAVNFRQFSSKAVDNENNNQSKKDCNLDNQAGGLEDADTTADALKLDEPVLSNEKPALTCPLEQEEDISEIPEVPGSGKAKMPLDVNVSQKRDGKVRDGTDGNPNCDSRETFEGNRIDQTGDEIFRTSSGEPETVACSEHNECNDNGEGLEYGDNDQTGGCEKLLSKEEFCRFVEYWVPAHISNGQLEQYCEMLLSKAVLLCSSSKSGPVAALRYILINARKCCNHPYTWLIQIYRACFRDR